MREAKSIVIIGTKGVGKTTLFRKLVKKYSLNPDKKVSVPIVNYSKELIIIKNNIYQLIDTPAFILWPQSEIEKGIWEQTDKLLEKCDLVCWVVDQISKETFFLSQYLKKKATPWILLFNKEDLEEQTENLFAPRILHPPHYLSISALCGTNLEQLTQKIVNLLPTPATSEKIPEEKKINLLIFGSPNSGKSTLMNYLLKENRSLVTPIAGTTQEPVISVWNWKLTSPPQNDLKISFQLVDTAGITKKQTLKVSLWKNCDLAWAVVDAALPPVKQVLQIVNLGEKYNKPLIIVINKCDLVKNPKILGQELKNRLKSLKFVPLLYLSALKGTGINLLQKTLEKMLIQSQKQISKKELEKTIEKMLINNPPPYHRGAKLKIYFTKHEPGLVHYFIFFVNNPHWVHFSYQRYITNYLRKNCGLEYLPIKVVFKKSV